MDYSFLAARLSFTFIYTCIFFSWQINSAAAILKNAIWRKPSKPGGNAHAHRRRNRGGDWGDMSPNNLVGGT